MRVAIVGAGAAGLTSARHISAGQGIDCDIFEGTSEVGGIWVYTDDTDEDQYGFPVHSAMYKDLMTNLPKEVMSFPDFPIPEQTKSYLAQEEILKYLNLYTDHFNLRHLIKFNCLVTEIRPFEDKWQVTSIHKPTKEETVGVYDAVMVCNGHFNAPDVPHIPDQEKFKGKITHSLYYRSPERFQRQKVLVIGAGPSGVDIALQISSVAHSVILSHHSKNVDKLEFPSNVTVKPDVLRTKNEEEIEFIDGSCCGFDTVVHCTGYIYNFPFLHESCGITVNENHVQPLYKHMVHPERPTLCFIGIPTYVCAFKTFDLQARFFCQFLNGSITLPSKQEMILDMEEEIQNRKCKGYSKKKSHYMGPDQQKYYDDLATMAKITTIPPVIGKMWANSLERLLSDPQNFRKDRYKIVNNDSYIVVS